MKLRLITVGRAPAWIDEGFSEYRRRLRRDTTLELDIVRSRPSESDENRILAAARPHELTVALDSRGEQMSSEQLAGMMWDWRMGGRDVALLIGGADGFSESMLSGVDRVWSLSKMTLPHLLVRVVVAEQLYRAYSIVNGHPYHGAH